MSEQRDESPIRRILVALNGAALGGVGRAAAVRLAAELRVALHGLFIEDVDLLHASALPFAKEISLSGGTRRPMTFESTEQSLQAIGERLRSELAERAREANIAWTFDVRRESIHRALLEAVQEEVLVVIGPGEIGPNLSRTPRSKPPSWGTTGPLIVVFDGQASSQRAAEAANQIRRAIGGQIAFQVLADDPSKTDELMAQATSLTSGLAPAARVVTICAKALPDVLQLARRVRASLLLIGADSPLMTEYGLRRLIERIGCPIGVVS